MLVVAVFHPLPNAHLSRPLPTNSLVTPYPPSPDLIVSTFVLLPARPGCGHQLDIILAYLVSFGSYTFYCHLFCCSLKYHQNRTAVTFNVFCPKEQPSHLFGGWLLGVIRNVWLVGRCWLIRKCKASDLAGWWWWGDLQIAQLEHWTLPTSSSSSTSHWWESLCWWWWWWEGGGCQQSHAWQTSCTATDCWFGAEPVGHFLLLDSCMSFTHWWWFWIDLWG